MTRRGAATLAAVLVALTVLAACGSSAKATPPLSKADYIARADAICTKYNGLVTQATKGLSKPTAKQITDTIKSKLVPLLKKQNKELSKLTPPVADKVVVGKFLADLKAVADDISAHTSAFVAAHGVSPLATTAATEAKAYGFKVCAKTGTG